MKKNLLFIGIIFLLFAAPLKGFASEEKSDFNAGRMILEHVVDAHDWHLLTIGEKHISIPLPIILFHRGKIHCFLSSKFEHGHHAYKGFKLENDGENKGKIVCVDEQGAFTGEKPLDLSITKTVVAIIFSALLILTTLLYVRKKCLQNKGKAPKGMQSLIEMLIIFIRDDVAKSAISGKKYEKYMPFLLTIFIFIFVNNLLGLIPIFPGGGNVTGNIGVTLVLAVFTFFVTNLNGNKNYWKDVFNTPGVPWWLKFPLPLMPIVEIMGIFTKPFVLMIRLFANMAAGHIIVLGFISMIFIFGKMSPALAYGVSPVPVFFSLFISLLELLVAFIQAYVFTLLSALYIGMATEEHGH